MRSERGGGLVPSRLCHGVRVVLWRLGQVRHRRHTVTISVHTVFLHVAMFILVVCMIRQRVVMYFSVCVDAWICLSDGVAARVPPLPCRYAYNRWSPLCLCVSVFPAAYAYIVSTATYRNRDDDGTDGRHEL